MAVSVRNCLGVDIGSQWVRIADVEMAKTGPRVAALLERPLALDPALNENQRNQAIAKTIQEMLKAGKVRSRRAVFCVPGQTVFVRTFTLPKSSPERLKQMVNFEARQRVPFPLDKTIIEYQLFPGPQPSELNILLVAIKREFIVNFMRLVRRTGLSPLGISVSSLALYNFHELNASQRALIPAKEAKPVKKKAAKKKTAKVSKKKGKDAPSEAPPEEPEEESLEEGDNAAALEEMGFEEIQAFVNLGASLMDLAIPKTGAARMIGFTRSVPLAGNEMDRLIKDKLGLESLEKARGIKEKDSVVLSTDFEIDGDADNVNAAASEAATSIADRIIAELRRSLDYYISQPDGVAVDSIVLSGGLSRLRYLPGYIEEKMGVPVTLAEPKHAQLRMPDNAPDPFAPFAMALGLGLQGLGIAQNNINFLPQEIKNIQGLSAHRYEVMAMGGMLVALIALSWGIADSRISRYNGAVSELTQVIGQHKVASDRVKEAQSQEAKVHEAYTTLGAANGNQDFWLQFLTEFMERRPPDILIDRIVCRVDGLVVVTGRAPSLAALNNFREELEKISWGSLPIASDNPNGALKVGIASYGENVADARFTRPVIAFDMVAKTQYQVGRYRLFSEEPVIPTPTPSPTPTPYRAPGQRG